MFRTKDFTNNANTQSSDTICRQFTWIVSWARLWTICIAVKVCMIVFYEYIILGEKHADTLKSPVRFLLTTYRVKLGAWDITTDTTKPFL